MLLNPAFEGLASSWPEDAADDPDILSVQTVLGKPALVVKRDSGGPGDPAAVIMVLEGVEVGMYGQYAPIEAPTLVQVAETVSA